MSVQFLFFQFDWRRCYNPVSLAVLTFAIACCVAFWVLCPFGDIWFPILVTAFLIVLVLLNFVGPAPTWKYRGELLWAVAFGLSFALVTIGDYQDQAFVAGNGVLVFLALPVWWVVWRLSGRRWFLSSGLMIAGAMSLLFWGISPRWREMDNVGSLLAPLPLVAVAGVGWVVVASPVLLSARRWKSRRVGGPALRLLALILWFAPAGTVGAIGPSLLHLDALWSAVSLTIVGVLLSVVVSEPLRFLLLEWSGLSSARERWLY